MLVRSQPRDQQARRCSGPQQIVRLRILTPQALGPRRQRVLLSHQPDADRHQRIGRQAQQTTALLQGRQVANLRRRRGGDEQEEEGRSEGRAGGDGGVSSGRGGASASFS